MEKQNIENDELIDYVNGISFMSNYSTISIFHFE